MSGHSAIIGDLQLDGEPCTIHGMVTTKVAPGATSVADNRLLPLVDHLARVGRRAGETTLAPGGLRPRHLIALRLLREAGPTNQQGLADSLRLDPSNVVGLLNELEARELVTRRRDPADRRRHIVELSAAGSGEVAQPFSQLRVEI